MSRTKGHTKTVTVDEIQRIATENATSDLARYGEVSREIEQIENDLNAEVKRLQAEAQKKVEPLTKERQDLHKAIEIFATSYREPLTGGDSKTIPLPSGKLFWRDGQDSIEVTDEKVAKRSIRRLGKAALYIKTSFSIRKDVLLKNPKDAKRIEGLEYKEAEERFYIAPSKVEVDTQATGKPGGSRGVESVDALVDQG